MACSCGGSCSSCRKQGGRVNRKKPIRKQMGGLTRSNRSRTTRSRTTPRRAPIRPQSSRHTHQNTGHNLTGPGQHTHEVRYSAHRGGNEHIHETLPTTGNAPNPNHTHQLTGGAHGSTGMHYGNVTHGGSGQGIHTHSPGTQTGHTHPPGSVMKRGGRIRKKQSGGLLRGPSHARGGMPAIIGGKEPVELEGGEYIIRKSSVNKYGAGTIARINQGLVDPNQLRQLKEGGRVKSNRKTTRRMQEGGNIQSNTKWVYYGGTTPYKGKVVQMGNRFYTSKSGYIEGRRRRVEPKR